MGFHITHRYGATESNPPLESLPKLLAELDDHTDDVEHGSVDLTHESEWNLGVSRGGYVIFENLESSEPRHMQDVPAAKIIQLWKSLSQGDLESIESEPWAPGY